ncbi:PREDICTED: eukaryotic translation initiation factor 3 subunit B [Nicrophorus vespilloides]|uniref:Eukaryotic translation initiation factor 3 subunit B n=1 Tax=Nicrophorus vespilloides TaxID=110193 RepID=A0ABM1N6P5_NICVS|nr:PREDICTED: eukaryotic translation initiation factor 3 subunit B [Nicrophorus vespilloides]
MAKKKVEDKNSENSDNTKNDGELSSTEEDPNFSDPEDFEDDISNEELLEDLLRNKPEETDGVESVIVVDGVPVVGPDRIEKLKSVINKLFTKFGNIVNEYYPVNEKGSTKGYIFLEYSSPLHAAEAVKLTNNHKLDKQHTFLVNIFTDFNKYEKIPEKWEPPTPEQYKGQGDLHYYLLEPDAYDQFCVVNGPGQSVQIWQNTQPEPTCVEDRQMWTQTYIKWSPLGTYLSTFHKQGIALWAGPNFTQYKKFSHNLVQFIDYSPCEKYLVTYSPQIDTDNPDQKRIIIWDIRTGLEKRSFDPEGPSAWPIFRWSHDDKYFARMGNEILSVYETPSFFLMDKKSLKIPGIRDFSWSPTDNIIAYWVAEDKDVPARVILLEIPNKQEIRSKNLFSVADCKIHWQKSGDYLCVKVDRYAKVRKEKNEFKYSGMYYNFEIFHMREKQIPVDSVDCKEPIQAFAWEPVGTKFSFIHGDSPNINVSFYGIRIGQAPILLKKFEKRSCNHLFWCPTGQYIVLAGVGSNGGSLEFVDTKEFLVMNSTDHFQMSDVEWDPTGRYVVTGVSVWKTKVDTGYWIWSFQGKILKRINQEKFAQLLWRPRPNTLLTDQMQKDIKKNLKKYYAQFESKDRMRQTRASKELIEKRAALMERFNEYRKSKNDEYIENKPKRLALRNNVDTDELDGDTENVEEEIVEFFIKEETILID